MPTAGGPRPKSAATQVLTDILAWEVSAVDRPANQRTFMLVKGEGGAPAQAPATTGGAGAAPAGDAAGQTPPPAGGAPVEKQLAAISPELQRKAIDAATAVSEKVAAFAALLAEAPTDEKAGPTPELAKLVQESVAELVALAQELAPSAAPVTQGAAPGGAPAGAPAAQAGAPASAASTPGDVLKSFEAFADKFSAEMSAKLEAISSRVEKSAVQVGALAVKVNDVNGRLAISKAAVSGNARTETPETPVQKAAPFVWPDDLGVAARTEPTSSTPDKGA